jgi:2-polyprenyl-6-methoxyphenol hydroxylase-like FAD-dependent oxidoreductase
MGWETPAVLQALASTDRLYFDAIAQVHVDRLTRGRVALLGDAGYGATMGGMGTGVAVVGAHVLAGELALAGGDHRTAFAEYEARIRDFARGCQKVSGNAGPFFAPPTERRIRSRDLMYRLLASRPLAGFFKRLTERAASGIRLREYPA